MAAGEPPGVLILPKDSPAELSRLQRAYNKIWLSKTEQKMAPIISMRFPFSQLVTITIRIAYSISYKY
jgi:hypothetical protein